VSIRFDPDLWPAKLPLVRFRGVFHHALTDDNGAMLMPFYRGMPRDARDACTLRLTLQAIHCFLQDPFKAWKLPAERLPEKFQRALDVHRKINAERLEIIEKYKSKVLHPELFTSKVKDEWLDPAFGKAMKENTPSAWRKILTEEIPGVYSFKLVTEAFCDTFLEEVFNFYKSGLPAKRPNSMNAYGIILNDIGMEPLIDELQRVLQPLGELLFPGPGNCWDGHHCFIVRYRSGEDLGLDMHTDDSDVTFNLCLGLDFTGAGLQFCGMSGAPDHRKHRHSYFHRKGHCVMHLGRRRHGADDITSGERLNLILWNHSSTYRSSEESESPPYDAETGPPDPVCVSYTHDRDFGNFKAYPKGKEHFRGRGWCPRRSFEYPGFEPDCESEEEDRHA
ncbi:2-oxoglutarate and iron-dependent oxygenase domain-containing protein CP2 (Protein CUPULIFORMIS 2), partial [Durusdinium trenchii]